MHQLRYFVAVAETGSFSRAAERRHISQPSLLQQIIKPEAKLGQKLFNRLGRRVALTDAGRLLIEHATKILSEVEAAERHLRNTTDAVRGSLSIGGIPTIAPYLLPPVLYLNRADHARSPSRHFMRSQIIREAVGPEAM